MLGKRKLYIWFDEPGNWYEADDTGARIVKKNKIFRVMKYSDDTTEEVRIALRKHACEGGGCMGRRTYSTTVAACLFRLHRLVSQRMARGRMIRSCWLA